MTLDFTGREQFISIAFQSSDSANPATTNNDLAAL